MMNVREEILKIVKYQSKVTLHNMLMKIPDREIAVSIMALGDREKELFFFITIACKGPEDKRGTAVSGKTRYPA